MGGYLVRHLLNQGADVTTLARTKRAPLGTRELMLATPWSREDLVDMLSSEQPDVVFHLVGTARSDDFTALYEANLFLSQRLLEAAARIVPQPLVVLMGSAAEYGYPAVPGRPSTESDLCMPLTSYGIAKHAQTLHGLAWARTGQPVVIARLFNPVGAGLPLGFVLSDFVKQIRDGAEVLRVGNLSVSRDFLDAADAARAIYDLSLCKEAVGRVVNVCSGVPQELPRLLDGLIVRSGRNIRVKTEPSRVRAADIPISYGSTETLKGLGIRPPAPLSEETLDLLMAG